MLFSRPLGQNRLMCPSAPHVQHPEPLDVVASEGGFFPSSSLGLFHGRAGVRSPGFFPRDLSLRLLDHLGLGSALLGWSLDSFGCCRW